MSKKENDCITRKDLEEVLGAAVTEILSVVGERFTKVEDDIDTIKNDVSDIKEDLGDVRLRVATTESKLDAIITIQDKHSTEITAIKRKLQLKPA